jgi:serine O-acetyltransferase
MVRKYSFSACVSKVVSGGSKIGKNCVILQQVTIGSIALPDSNGIGSPTIGDNCYIGAGAMIIGNITVGNNVRIGANTTVYKDVPDNSIVVSAVQKNIPASKELDNKFYTYKNGKRVFFDEGKFKEVTDPKILKIFEDASE